MSSNDDIIEELRNIKSELRELKISTSRMDDHITFIEKVFGMIRVPLFALMDVVRYITPKLDQDQPRIS